MGYKRVAARAKIAHDVVLAAIRSSGMKGFVTIKGGVVMSGITKAVRRATMDMDVDFVRHSISREAIEAFVAKLDEASDCSIAIDEAEEARLRNRREAFIRETGTRKGCHVTMVTTYGIKRNRHSGVVQSQVTMDQLFAN